MEKTSVYIKNKLEKMSIKQVQFFANLATNKQLDDFINWGRDYCDEEKEKVFLMSEENERKLATEKAFSRGKVASITELVYIIKGAPLELERRAKNG